MNSLYTRCGAALLCATALAACGGGDDGAFPLSGTINGLNRQGLVLSNKGKQLTVDYTLTPTSFSFPDALATDEEFEVKVEKSPGGQVCTATNNKSKANYYTYNQTIINCSTVPYELSGTIEGLVGSGLVIQNGNVTVSPAAKATTFSFGVTIPNTLPYALAVLAQPTGQTCTIFNAGGIMPEKKVDNVKVVCLNNGA